MTTIAWDGTTLATDRLAVYGTTKRRVRKLFISSGFLYGASGMLADAYIAAEWLAAGADPDVGGMFSEAGCYGIAVNRKTGAAFTVEGARPRLIPLYGKAWATGSGQDFANAAMALGKSAVEAVKLAARFDVYTGGGVDSVKWRQT